MPEHRLEHDLDEDPVLRSGDVLDDPLQFVDGAATVDDQATAESIDTRHLHIEYVGPVDADDEDADDEPAIETPPFDPADKTVDELEAALEDDDYDWNAAALRGLREAEVDGKARDTALDAIDERLA